MKEWIFGCFQGWGPHYLTGQLSPVRIALEYWLSLTWLPSTSMWPSLTVLTCRAPFEQAHFSSALEPQVQSTHKGSRLHKCMGPRRWGSLGTVLESCHHDFVF